MKFINYFKVYYNLTVFISQLPGSHLYLSIKFYGFSSNRASLKQGFKGTKGNKLENHWDYQSVNSEGPPYHFN